MHLIKQMIIVVSVLALFSAFAINSAFAGDDGWRGRGFEDGKGHAYGRDNGLAYDDEDERGRRFGRWRPQRVNNVIILIPDGCSQSIQTLARWYKGEKLTVDDLNAGVVKHEMANSVITGSAAAATAFSSGYKTTARFLGIGPRANDVLSTYEWPEDPETFAYKPVATVMEGANLKGMATGLISTSRFTHATPAAWASHSAERGNGHTDISEQMVYNEIDLIFGGGMRNLYPKETGGKRIDGEDLREVLSSRSADGYIAQTKDEMASLTGLPAYGMYAYSHMDSEIDREYYDLDEPSLSDMTAKAIDLLSQDRDGFILMVEGSQVDWAGHNNDPIYMVKDFLEFDNAVTVAMDFAKRDGNTLVLAFPDHNTGGMDIGNRKYNWTYTGVTVEDLLEPLKGMKVSAGALASEIGGDTSFGSVQAKIEELWGITIDQAEYDEIMAMKDGDAGSLSYALARIISKNHTAIGWTSHGHNAEDVPLWAFGPGAPKGMLDNTELSETVADALGLNMERIQKRLFVNLDDVYGENGWTLDESDPANPVARLSGDGVEAALPINKDILKVTADSGEPRSFDLPGVVAAPTLFNSDIKDVEPNRVYVPRKAAVIMHLYGIR